MSELRMRKLEIQGAANTLAPALTQRRELGFEFSRSDVSDEVCEAQNETCRLIGKDALEFLGVARQSR
ncbi:MAG TPA: hypothetical protein PKE57_01775 [Cellvibrionaceae bacterium]|nr:hypothetical protein [Cellvibrionaceae bacterium]